MCETQAPRPSALHRIVATWLSSTQPKAEAEKAGRGCNSQESKDKPNFLLCQGQGSTTFCVRSMCPPISRGRRGEATLWALRGTSLIQGPEHGQLLNSLSPHSSPGDFSSTQPLAPTSTWECVGRFWPVRGRKAKARALLAGLCHPGKAGRSAGSGLQPSLCHRRGVGHKRANKLSLTLK